MSSPGLLSGVVIVDLTRVLAGPYCTMVLADIGARVIKVENPKGGDDARHYPPFVGDRSAYFMSLNRGKESVALDLKDDADRASFERLLESADVLVENYRAGTLDRLGYDWESLHARYPRLILASCSGFGATGPYATRPAYDMVVQAMGGIMSLTGHAGGPPTRVGTSIGDITAGLFTAVGIASALVRRTSSGQGSRIDVGMLDCQLAILENAIARYTATGDVPGPLGARHPSIAPFEAYQTLDDPIIVAAGNDVLFAKLAASLGAPALADDPRFITNRERVANVDALTGEIGAILITRSRAEWLEILGAAGIPCGPLNDVAEAMSDPQILARNMVVESDHPVAGTLRMAGNPIKVEGLPDPAKRPPAPELDQDRDAVLGASTTRR